MKWGPRLRKSAPRDEKVWESNEQILAEWTEHLRIHGYSENVLNHYPTDLRVFMEVWGPPGPGQTLLTELEDPDIQAFIEAIGRKCSKLIRGEKPQCLKGHDLAKCPLLNTAENPETYHACPGYQPLIVSGVLSYLRSIQSFYRWLSESGYIKYNPANPVMGRFLQRHKADLQKLKRNPRRRVLKVEEVRRLVEGAPLHHAVAYAIAAKCFLREHEALKLRLGRYCNLEEGWIEIPPESGKFGSKRLGNNRIIIDAELRPILERYLVWRERKVKRDTSGQPLTDRLVLTIYGKEWGKGWAGNFRKTLHTDCVRLGIMTGKETKREERFNTHCFRAFATTWARDKGINDAQLHVLRGDKGSGAIDVYDFHLGRLPGLYQSFAPVLGIQPPTPLSGNRSATRASWPTQTHGSNSSSRHALTSSVSTAKPASSS